MEGIKKTKAEDDIKKQVSGWIVFIFNWKICHQAKLARNYKILLSKYTITVKDMKGNSELIQSSFVL